MAKFEFWASLSPKGGKYFNLVEIPDEKFEGLNEQQKESLLVNEHTKWILNNAYGGWEKFE